jgi:hypothetical protein
LAELWWRGRLSALPSALLFTFALNLFLVARYLYPQWIAGGLVSLGFWVGLLLWIFCVVHSVRELPYLIAPRSVSQQPDRFPEAQAAFLQGQWSEAEGLLTDLLAIEPRDPPALLLLTGVYRHTGRPEAASLLLQELRRLEFADAWWLEIQGEGRRLERTTSESPTGGMDGDPHDKRAGETRVQKSAADLTADRANAA